MLLVGISSIGLELAKKEVPYFRNIDVLNPMEYILAVEHQRYSSKFALEHNQGHFQRK